MKSTKLVDGFCTVPIYPETKFDHKSIEGAKIKEFPFENYNLKGYSWGSGKDVLLVHGWGSKASHMALIGRHLARKGFRTLAFDGPGHGRSLKNKEFQRSSLFEFCRAISIVAESMPYLYAVIGHSLGAVAAAFTISGQGLLHKHKISAERLVMISSPISISRVIDHYARQINLDEIDKIILADELEKEFNFSISDYNVSQTINQIKSHVLIVHDEFDEDIPVGDAITIKKSCKDARILVTKGAGHRQILVKREVMKAVYSFLS